tara:strand:+ start:217 stop:360 length:144 start_codon:yes stop_codon:yes gene_type:complete
MFLSLYDLNISDVRTILLEIEKNLNKHQREILDDLVISKCKENKERK